VVEPLARAGQTTRETNAGELFDHLVGAAGLALDADEQALVDEAVGDGGRRRRWS
jgi:hypothetical protein